MRILTLTLIATACVFAQSKPQALFRPLPAAQVNTMRAMADSPADAALKSSTLVKRSRLVNVDFAQIGDSAASAFAAAADRPVAARPRLLLNLFEDVNLTVAVQSVRHSTDGQTVTWIGSVEGAPRSEVMISKNDDATSASISVNGKFYQVRPIAGSSTVHVVQEVNRDSYPRDKEPLPARTPGPAADRPLGLAQDAGNVIDVMVVYTTAAKDAAGGKTAIELLIANAEADANIGYANSRLTHTVRVVHMEEVSYDESAGFDSALTALAGKTDGQMDQVHQLRDRYGADMVSLLINNTEFCGLAYLMRDLTQDFSGSAFSVVHYDCAVGNHSFAHEMGHNLGAGHDRANGCSALFSYSCGFQHAPEFRTIMAYQCAGQPCPRENYWSNPAIVFNGIPTGIAEGQPDATDNAATLRQTVPIAAQWRQTVPPPQTVPMSPERRTRSR